MDSWISVITQLGVPTAFLAAICLVNYQIGKWIGTHVLVPVANKHIAFLDSTIETNKKLEVVVGKISDSLDEHHRGIQQIHIDTLETKTILLHTTAEEKLSTGKMIELLESIDKKTVKPQGDG